MDEHTRFTSRDGVLTFDDKGSFAFDVLRAASGHVALHFGRDVQNLSLTPACAKAVAESILRAAQQ